jgi:auxin responsive GH3 family protein
MEPKNTNGSSRSYEHDIISWFEDISKKAGQVQTETLRRILELNWGVEYLNKWLGDINIQDMDASALESLYTSLVPPASHADLEPYISRIADGDTVPLLTKQPITLLSLRCVLFSSPLLSSHLFFILFFSSFWMLGPYCYSKSLSF